MESFFPVRNIGAKHDPTIEDLMVLITGICAAIFVFCACPFYCTYYAYNLTENGNIGCNHCDLKQMARL